MPTPTRLLVPIALAMAIAGTPALHARLDDAVAADRPAVETIAGYPHGQFLENLDIGGDGTLRFTSYVDRTLLRWNGNTAPTPIATLDVHPVGILHVGDRIVVSAHGASFLDGPAFTASNQILVLDSAGREQRRTPAPDARFLNGLSALDQNTVLVADSIAGTIWRYDLDSGELTPWLRHPLLAVDPASTSQRPGANGLKRRDDWLYVSNSSRGALYRVGIDGLQPSGEPVTFANTGPIDDFTFLPDGSIAAATHGKRLLLIDADGGVSDILTDGCDACTSVARAADGTLIVTTSGNLLEGGKEPARLIRLSRPTTEH